jgi:predicted exporter
MAVAGLTRHAHATVAGRSVEVDVDVRHDAARPASHIVVLVRGDAPGALLERAEYVTDHADGEQALSAGFEIACTLIDSRRRRKR